jgi:hypothetical protein
MQIAVSDNTQRGLLVCLTIHIIMGRRNLHDAEVPINVQSTCVRLMLNLVEVVMQRRQSASLPDLEAYRGLVASILATLSDKLAAVARSTPALMAEGAHPRLPKVFKLPPVVRPIHNCVRVKWDKCPHR